MSRRRWNFSVLQLLLLTALCGLCAGVVAMSRQTAANAYLENLLFSPDGQWLAACYHGGRVRVWDVHRRRVHSSPSPLASDSHYVDFSGAGFVDGDTLAVLRCDYDGQGRRELVLWDVQQNKLKTTIPTVPWVYRYCVSPAGKVVTVHGEQPSAAWGPNTIVIQDLSSGQTDSVVKPDCYFNQLLLSSDGKTLVARVARRGSDGIVAFHLNIRDISDNSKRSPKTPIDGYVLAISDNGERVCILNAGDGSSAIWDLETGNQISEFHCTGYLPTTVEFSPDGDRLITCYSETQVRDVANGMEATGFAGSDLASQQQVYIARYSPDGRWIATGSDRMISLWDAKTFAHVADLYRDRRGWAGLAYIFGFLAWATAWGWLARRQRARDKDRVEQPTEATARPLPRIVRAGLQPRQTWLRLLLIAVGVGLALAWVFADGVQRQFGWSYPATLLALVPICAVAFLTAVIGLVLGSNIIPATIRRWRGVPFAAAITRAERAAGMPARRMQLGPVTACFFGQSHLEATLAEDFDVARRRFAALFGTSVELRRPLTVLVFERSDWYDAHLDGHLPMAGVYWMGIDRQITICEETCLRWLTEPRWIWRQLLARYLFEQHKGFPPSSGLAGILSCSLLLDLDEHLPQRVHSRLQAMLRRGDPVGTFDALNWNDRQLISAALDQQNRESFLTMAAYSTQSLSLAEFLLGDAAGERAERFQRLVRQWQRRDSLPDRLQHHFSLDADTLQQWPAGAERGSKPADHSSRNTEAFQQAWRQWILDHPTQPCGRPMPRIERYFQTRMLPLILDRSASLSDRALAIRHLGLDGYELGIDALIELLQDSQSARLRPDVIWTLESISGRLHGSDAAAWQQWWNERREQIFGAPPAGSTEDEADVFVAALADDDRQPVTAELVDEPLTAVKVEDSKEPREDDDPPRDGERGGRAKDDGGKVGILTNSATEDVGILANSATEEVGILTNSATENVVPPMRLRTVRILLGIGGLIAVVWSVYVTLYLGEELAFVSVLGMLAGVYAMTRWTGAETHGLTAAARLLASRC
ncbi:MAG: WD40 repeat domain-containing protein [Pirellulaceae bacterium]|nr:WD40 repeat domain-containing protein [Pirellulaceae bacterium]